MYVSTCIFILVAAYLIGSVPFGILLAKAFGLPDPRTIGSGNIGATNMLRTGRKEIALLTLLLDMGKGVVAVVVARMMGDQPSELALAVLGAAVGHMYSPWLKFSGGKGVATILGAAFVFSWPVAVAFCGVWLLVFIVTRYVSFASLAALIVVPIATALRMDIVTALIIAIAVGIAIYKHRSNIARLLAGTEPKMSLGGKRNAA